MKKISKIIFTLIVSFLIINKTYALDQNNNSGSVKVSYTTDERYTIIIPADFNLSTDSVRTTVLAKNVLLDNNKTLNVKMSTQNYDSGYYVEYEGSKIKYNISINSEEQTSNEMDLLNVSSGMTQERSYIDFITTEDNINEATKAGEHTDYLTFICSIN